MKCSDKEWQHCNKEKMGCNGCAYNDEISIGDYVRTEAGIFYKILSAVKNTFLCIEIKENATKIEVLSDLEPVVKHSKDIIDLIEKNDYVNGEQIIDIWNGNRISSVKSNFDNDDIKSIVTKEQIKQIEYRIGD